MPKNNPRQLTTDVTRRFILVMREIISDSKKAGGKIRNVKAFAETIKASRNYLLEICSKPDRNVTVQMCCDLIAVYKVNANWLFTGEGEQLQAKQKTIIDRIDNLEKVVTRLNTNPDKNTSKNKRITAKV